ncbi:Transmembrane 9 superfamily member [Heracleum sosnowskyi]|uniref:Transmembrane 9 superfamily member n=1 Tax=Heracleum sosnowskyi TaxID=360622 RepID=A0AAD8M9C5_9APIA|nr:Transmembrane 9 superfamily member [Heracleum sosnowskyi]
MDKSILSDLILGTSICGCVDGHQKGVFMIQGYHIKRVSHNKLGKYQADDPVTLWVNKVGPYNNPQETYNYYPLPFCHPPGEAGHKWGGLGEVLGGNELINSQIDIKYLKNVNKGTICELELDEDKVKQFKEAIENSYWFEFFMVYDYEAKCRFSILNEKLLKR